MAAQGRLLHSDWDLYDTRHTVFRLTLLPPEQLEAGYWRAYKEFYTWRNLWASEKTKESPRAHLRHLTYAAGWKRFEPLWDWLIRAHRIARMRPLLEGVLTRFGELASPGQSPPSKPFPTRTLQTALPMQEPSLPLTHMEAAEESTPAS